MNLLVDENVHRLIVVRLQRDGHDVAQVATLAAGITDDDVLALAVAREALLITNDLDFGELIYSRGARHAGVLLLRFGATPYTEQIELVARTLKNEAGSLLHAFSVLSPTRLRVRT